MEIIAGISKFDLILALLVFCMFAGPACAAALEDHDNTSISVGNDNGTYLVPGTTYPLNLEDDMADLHIASDPANSAGDISKINTTSGTFYITCTNESRVFDDNVLMLAVNGKIEDDFSVAITSSGYRWAGPAENSNLPEFGNLTYVSSALSETFEKTDLSYGPQIWKPSYSADSPIYNSQNMSFTEDSFSLVFIDLNAGALCNAENMTSIDDLTDRGAVKIDYTFENLQSFAVFNAYGLTNTSAEIITTNDVSESLYSVLTEPAAAGPVQDNITVTPSTASVEINGTTTFTATAYDTEGSVMSGITFNWSVFDETIGNVTSEGLFTGLAVGKVNVTASCGNVSGYAVVTVSEVVVPISTPTPTPASETYGGVIPAVDDVYLKVANDYGARFDDFGNDTFHIFWGDGNTLGGQNAIHISQSPEGYGEVTSTNSKAGTFYVTETGGRGYHDEIFLCVAVNGTIPDDFRIHIKTEGYQWTPNPIPHSKPLASDISEKEICLDEWFDKNDFIYGPQTWRPAADMQYPIYPGHDVTDTANSFRIMFIDLKGGILSTDSLKVQYEIENLNTMAAFNIYGYGQNADEFNDCKTSWTNRLLGETAEFSGWYVSGIPLPDAASVVLEPVSAVIPVNGRQQFTATAYDSDGKVIKGAPIIWSVSDSSVGSIDSEGLFTPVTEGSVVVMATSGSVSQTASVTVTAAVEKVLTTITLDPDSGLMYTDRIGNIQFIATGYDQFGDEISAVYTWSSTVPVVGSIDGTGFFTGKTEGTTVVSATSSGVSQTATVEIREHPDWNVTLIGGITRALNRSEMIDLAAAGTLSYTDVRDLYWTGIDLTSVIALFDDNDPSTFNTALAGFDYNITIKGQASGNEKTVLITSFELADENDTFILAYLMDGYEIPGYAVDGRTYWPLKLTGTAIAGYGRNLEEITSITIELPPDVRIIGLTSDTVKTTAGGSSIQFAAAAYDSDDIVIDYIPFTWSVSDSSIGTVNEDGLFTPLKAGKVNVTATYKSVSGSTEIEVMDNISSVKTWYVDAGGNGDFTSIRAVIDYGAKDGDTIVVRDGIYEDKMIIDKSITLTSENGPDSTVIRNVASDLLDDLLTVTADDVKISGFNFSFVHNKKRYAAIQINSAKNTEISGNLFSDGYYAVSGSDVENTLVEDNYFTSDGGSSTRSNVMVYLTYPNNSVIRNNTMDKFNYGIYILGSGSGNLIKNNTFNGGYNDGTKLSGYGIKLEGFRSSVSNNYFSDCNYGLYIKSGADIAVSGNYLESELNYGLYIKRCENVTASDNIIGDASYGLYSEENENLIVNNNLFGNSDKRLLVLSDVKDVTVSHNSFGDAAQYILYLNTGLEDVTVCNNKFGSAGDAVIYANRLKTLDGWSLYMNNFSNCAGGSKGFFYPQNSDLIPNLNSSSPMAYTYNGKTYTAFIGNRYNTYSGEDTGGDGIGDTPFTENGACDYSPLVSPTGDYLILEAADVKISSPASSLKVGESIDFTASAIDQRGLDFPGAVIEFSSGNPAIGTIDSSTGHFGALSHGTVTVTASSGNAAASMEVTVEKATEKEETTNFEISNCTIKGNGDGGNSVKVNSGSATIVNNSICMQGSGFNLTIRTAAAPVINGGNVEGTVENIVLETNPVTADLRTPGNVSAGVSLNLTGLPAGAAITTTLTQDVDNDSQSAFQLAASEDGLNLNAVAYTMNIVKTNLANGADIKEATISMAVSHAWVMANGGYGSMKIIRFAEDDTKEVLETVYVGSEGDMDLFKAYSPHGLSIFGLAATSTASSSEISSSTVSGGKSSVAAESVMNIGAGEMVSLVLDESAITKTDLKAAADIPELMLTVEKVSKPSGIEDAPDDVYQYVEVIAYHAPEDSIAMATLHFNIAKDWLDSIYSTPSDVSVYRYDEGAEEWILLSTVSDGSDVYAYKFFADTGEFGVFAITAKEGTASADDASNPETVSNPSETQQSSGSESTGSTEGGISIPYLILATGLIIGIPAAGYGWLRIQKNN